MENFVKSLLGEKLDAYLKNNIEQSLVGDLTYKDLSNAFYDSGQFITSISFNKEEFYIKFQESVIVPKIKEILGKYLTQSNTFRVKVSLLI